MTQVFLFDWPSFSRSSNRNRVTKQETHVGDWPRRHQRFSIVHDRSTYAVQLLYRLRHRQETCSSSNRPTGGRTQSSCGTSIEMQKAGKHAWCRYRLQQQRPAFCRRRNVECIHPYRSASATRTRTTMRRLHLPR